MQTGIKACCANDTQPKTTRLIPPMQHPDAESRGWELIWFGKYSLLFLLPLVFLIIAFFEQKWWFLGLSVYLVCAIAFLSWRAMHGNVKKRWRIGLATVIGVSWSYCLLVVFAGPGDTKICYDRLHRPHYWLPLQNLGPSPSCEGVPLQDVEVR